MILDYFYYSPEEDEDVYEGVTEEELIVVIFED